MGDYKVTNITASSLPDAWFKTVYKCLEIGRDFTIDQGSYEGQKRLEFDFVTIHIKKPGMQPYLPTLPEHYGIPDPVPDGMDYINRYMLYLIEINTILQRLPLMKLIIMSVEYTLKTEHSSTSVDQ